MISSGPAVSILLCTRNRVVRLRQTIDAIGRLRVPDGFTAELIVVDNGSSDGTAAMVQACTLPNMAVRLVPEPRRGVAFARNAAVQAATGDILLFTDDDMRLPPNWIEGLCRPILAGEADAVAGKVVIPPHLMRPWMTRFHRTALASTEAMDPHNPGEMFCGSMAFARRVLDRVPAFDTELGPGTDCGALEDTLFSWQVAQAGFRIAAAFHVAAEHHFEEDHLKRAAFVRDARTRAQSVTYIRYHWLHLPETDWTHRKAVWQLWRHPRMLVQIRRLALLRWRLAHWQDWHRPEGITKHEFGLLMSIHRLEQFMKERKRPRNYDARGLVKRTPQASAHAGP